MSYIKEVFMINSITDAELDIMKIVWANKEGPTLFAYLMDELGLKGKTWQKNSVITLLLRLIDKGFLKAKKTGRRNEYTALVSETEYQTTQTKGFLDKVFEGSAGGLVASLIQSDLLAEDEYNELKALLGRDKHNE
jgi:predicted transcriptional regulator